MKKQCLAIVLLVLALPFFMSVSLCRAEDNVCLAGSLDGFAQGLDSAQAPGRVACSIWDAAGTTQIFSAPRGSVVLLQMAFPPVTNLLATFNFRMPVLDPAYSDQITFRRTFAGSTAGALAPIVIPAFNYIQGTGRFIGNVPGIGRCVAYLTITP